MNSSIKQEWFTAFELEGMGDLPNKATNITRRATKENWEKRQVQGKKGIAYEYHYSSFPLDVQRQLGFEQGQVSAGFGSFNEGVTKPDEQTPYSAALLRKLGVNPKYAAVFWADGISMRPTIDDGDQMLVDLKRKEIKGDKIYLVQNGSSVWVKRVKIRWDGVELISDNREEYPPIILSKDEAENLQVIGQLVHLGKNMI